MGDDRNKDVHWLFCLVFPVEVKGKEDYMVTDIRNEILDNLNNAKLVTQMFYGSTKSQIFCKVGATDSRLLIEADIQQYKLQIEEKSLQIVAESTNDVGNGRSPIYLDYPYGPDVEIHHQFKKRDITGHWKEMSQTEVGSFITGETPLNPFEYIFIRYNDEWEVRMKNDHGVQIYKTYEDGTILRPADRIKLCKMAIERSSNKDPEHGMPGGGLNVQKRQFDKDLLAWYPLQLGTSRQMSKELTPDALFSLWNKTWWAPWDQPFEKIRGYCGEKICMYFAFLGHYTLWLVLASIFGTITFCFQLYQLQKLGTFNFLGADASKIEVKLNGASIENMTQVPPGQEDQLVFITTMGTQHIMAPLFAFFISLWASFLIEFWKRKQARFALKWGTSDYEATARSRVQFTPSHIVPSAVTGEPIEYYSKLNFLTKVGVSVSVLFGFITVVIAAIVGIVFLKVFMSGDVNFLPKSIAPQVALVVNAVLIIILGNVYKGVAKKLTDWENHRTDIQYEDHLIAKTFVFSFVNSYSTLTYMAFIKSGRDILNETQFCISNAEDLESKGFPVDKIKEADQCYAALSYSLVIIFLSQIIVNNTMEVGVPFIMARVKAFLDFRSHAKKLAQAGKDVGDGLKVAAEGVAEGVTLGAYHGKEKAEEDSDEEKEDISVDLEDLQIRQRMKSPLEMQLHLKVYETPFEDYLELALQFGYVTLFVAAFPLAPVFALLNNYIEIYVDSYKVCILSRRPTLDPAQDIGTWQKIFQIMGFAAVISNASVILFTTDFLVVEEGRRVWLWVLFVTVVLGLKTVVDFAIPDVPTEVRIQLERQEFFLRKLFLQEKDDEPLSDSEKKRNSHRYSLDRKIESVDPYINELMSKASAVLRQEKGEDWDAEEIFNAADTNHNGVISLKELKKALLKDENKLITHLTKFEISIMVSAMDCDGDGEISKKEFFRMLNF